MDGSNPWTTLWSLQRDANCRSYEDHQQNSVHDRRYELPPPVLIHYADVVRIMTILIYLVGITNSDVLSTGGQKVSKSSCMLRAATRLLSLSADPSRLRAHRSTSSFFRREEEFDETAVPARPGPTSARRVKSPGSTSTSMSAIVLFQSLS